MAIKPVKAVTDIPTEELDDRGPVELPISEEISLYFDENSKDTREVLETVRKACLTFKRN